MRRQRRAVPITNDAIETVTVPAGLNHRRPPLLSSKFAVADVALELLPAESEICRIPLSRRKDRVFPAAPLVATGSRKDNRRTFGFSRTWARNALLGQLAVAAFGGSALAFDAVSAQRVTTAENEGRPRFSVLVGHPQFASGTFVSRDFAFWHGHLPAVCLLGTPGMQLKWPHARVTPLP